VNVIPRQIYRESNGSKRKVGIQYEPWFTSSFNWFSSQVSPLLGYYDLSNKEVVRQHLIWLTELNVDFLIVDWTNHLWGKSHWDPYDTQISGILENTTVLFDTASSMKKEGIPVPQLILFTGISNGPPASMVALKEELDWIFQTFVSASKYEGLWFYHHNRPLVMILDCGAVAHPEGESKPVLSIPYIEQTLEVTKEKLDEHRKRHACIEPDDRYTVRWVSTQLQITGQEKLGYWSWMDGCDNPIITHHEGKPEAVTINVGYFSRTGWTGDGAKGRRNGKTLLTSYNSLKSVFPEILMVHQFNEFVGQLEGMGYGPDKNIFVDSYSMELSDEIEPTSMTAQGYRGQGGWGFYYYNLTKSLIDLYKQQDPSTTILIFTEPDHLQNFRTDESISLKWMYVGKAPDSFSLFVEDQMIVTGLTVCSYDLDLSTYPTGQVRVKLIAEGTRTNYHLLYEQDAERLSQTIPSFSEILIVIE
jgi:hypothetical protein